ncbi:MAG: lactate utilization protein [Flavobacteriales bacterium]|nr:lactate utilization protein [Flavobacteriales bacterium]
MQNTAKEKILKKVRKALIDQSPELYPGLDFKKNIYNMPEGSDQSLDIAFAKSFAAADGKFIFCENKAEFIANLKTLAQENKWDNIHVLAPEIQNLLTEGGIPFNSDEADMEQMDAGITACEYLIARSGSIMISSKQISGRRMAVYPPSHLVIANSRQLVMHVKDALDDIKNRYPQLPSMISTITGPSRTADIEKTLILGAHGPKELYVFLLDEPLSQ